MGARSQGPAHRAGGDGRRSLRRLAALVTTLPLLAIACSDGAAIETTTTTTVATTTSTRATTTTTTAAGTTSTIQYFVLDVALSDAEAGAAVSEVYAWLGDRTLPVPDIPTGLATHLEDAEVEASATLTGEFHSAEIGDRGRVGVARIDGDIVLLADEGAGWTVVGAWLPRFGLDPWFGAPTRHVLVIGTDARPGQDQQNFRADSLHILSSSVADAGGGILGIPRDTYVTAPYGDDKYTNVNVYSGQQTMVDIAADLSGLPVEGYLITGFLNFERLVNDFGGVVVDVPFAFDDWRAEAYISAGLQRLWGQKALGFSRSRTLAGGDFTRSYHQGLVIAAALAGVQEQDIASLPAFLALLDRYTWTDLSLGDLTTLAAGAFLLDPANVGNRVLPGTITTRGGASVVVLTEAAEDLFRDLDDGVLTPAG